MENRESPNVCHSLPTIREKRWPYDEYYLGDKDTYERKVGEGVNHWVGAESLEWYTGQFLHDTMHGEGGYRWRHKDPDGAFVTYEGMFYANRMHGYGEMSYPDGRVFTGLFHNDVRWGPGIERKPCLRANVGLWRGTQLARLAWKPAYLSMIPDFTTGHIGAFYLHPFRTVLVRKIKKVGQTNSAIELLKKHGLDPVKATTIWKKVYSTYCTDLESALCPKDLFEYTYYNGKVRILEEIDKSNDHLEEEVPPGSANEDDASAYFAWNNNEIILHMMKHSYQHDNQRSKTRLRLQYVLNGPRKKFRPAAKHEYDCRTLLMASFLGHITNVAQLVNEEDVFPDIADMQGNTALMYATCGDQTNVMHFLIEAGANVNSVSDSCFTPLGLALIRFLSVVQDIVPNAITSLLLPSSPPPVIEKAIPDEERITADWIINRETTKVEQAPTNHIIKPKPQTSSIKAKYSNLNLKSPLVETEYDSDTETFSEEKRLYLTINSEYGIRLGNLISSTGAPRANISYMFDVRDMVKDVEMLEDEQAKASAEKNPRKITSRLVKDTKTKTKLWADINPVKDVESLTSAEKEKEDKLAKIHLTILQLLSDGADPKLVQCPQPAILLAIKSGRPDIVRLMVSHGADINQKYPTMFNYSVLDMLISEPFTDESIEMIRTLLELGAEVNHRLRYEELTTGSISELKEVPGPTLLHVLVAKKQEFEYQEEMRREVAKLLLEHNGNPTIKFKGRSPIAGCMMTSLELLDTFINYGQRYLNSVINTENHTILMKIFSRDYFKLTLGIPRFPILTNLLLYGADPLIEGVDGDVTYGNVFEFAAKTLNDIAPALLLPPPPPPPPPPPDTDEGPGTDNDNNGKENRNNGKDKGNNGKDKGKNGKGKGKGKNFEPEARKTPLTVEESEYREAVDLLTECTRLLHVRWLQAKLMKEIIDVIHRYNHRPWVTIMREINNGYSIGLWLTTLRCLEIWDILKTTRRKKCKDENVLRKLLCIVQFYQKRVKAMPMLSVCKKVTSLEQNDIESDVALLLKEHTIASKLSREASEWNKAYVKPELFYKADDKFNICFECSLRLKEGNVKCKFCNLVSFCNLQCIHNNITKTTSHPCSEMLSAKYFPLPEEKGESDNSENADISSSME